MQSWELAVRSEESRVELLKPALRAELGWGATPSVSKEKAIYANLLRIIKGVDL